MMMMMLMMMMLMMMMQVRLMVTAMLEVRGQTRDPGTGGDKLDCDNIVRDLLQPPGHADEDTGPRSVTMEEFLVWTVDNVLAREMGQLIVQLCHVGLGLRPSSRLEEGSVVRGWLAREERGGLVPGQVWYLVPMSWWTHWHNFVNLPDTPAITPAPTPTGTLTKKKTNLSSSLASDSCSKVVGTGYTPLAEAADNSRPVTPASRSSSSAGSESPATPRRGGAASVRPGLIDTTSLLQSSHYR